MREIEEAADHATPATPQRHSAFDAKSLLESQSKRDVSRGRKGGSLERSRSAGPRARPGAAEKKKGWTTKLKKTEQQKRVENQERAALEKREKAAALEKDRQARRVEQGIRLKEELAAKEEKARPTSSK